MKVVFNKAYKLMITGMCIVACICLSACNASNDKANQLINENGHKYKKATVKTPKGTEVTTWKYTSKLSDEEKKECNKYVEDYYPNAKKLRGPTLSYNCHSYAWHSTSTDNTHWINNPSPYWKDKSYNKYASSKGTIPKEVTKGSKVVYWDEKSASHSGIVTKDKTVKSKWGMCGLYEHSPKDCPYSQSDGTFSLTFYKKS